MKRFPLEPQLTRLIIESVGEDSEFTSEEVLQGRGSVRFKDGNQYVGEFEGGRMHGRGRYTWKDGTVYEGDFYHNSINGEGTTRHVMSCHVRLFL